HTSGDLLIADCCTAITEFRAIARVWCRSSFLASSLSYPPDIARSNRKTIPTRYPPCLRSRTDSPRAEMRRLANFPDNRHLFRDRSRQKLCCDPRNSRDRRGRHNFPTEICAHHCLWRRIPIPLLWAADIFVVRGCSTTGKI